jgi:TIR domain
MVTPYNQRAFDIFLSHSSVDKLGFVDALYEWLTQRAGQKVWYDRSMESGGISGGLDEAVSACRGAIVVLSEQAIRSKWVAGECDRFYQEHANSNGNFKLATLRLDRVDAPGLMRSFNHIDIADRTFSPAAAALLMKSLYGGSEVTRGRSIYLARGWRDSERAAANSIARFCKTAGLRLVCDHIDQPVYEPARVRAIMDSCGGFISILPHRNAGGTSSYILREAEMAKSLRIPMLSFVHEEISIQPDWSLGDVARFGEDVSNLSIDDLEDRFGHLLALFVQSWRKPGRGEHVFRGHTLERTVDDRFQLVTGMLSQICGLPVISGGQVGGADAQNEIVRLIREAEICIIDITNSTYPDLPEKINFALNSCIEAGIALGAAKGESLYLTCEGERRSPPFMFRNKQVHFYDSALSLVGLICQIALAHRRTVL